MWRFVLCLRDNKISASANQTVAGAFLFCLLIVMVGRGGAWAARDNTKRYANVYSYYVVAGGPLKILYYESRTLVLSVAAFCCG